MANFTLDIQIDNTGIKSLTDAHMSVAMLQAAPDSGYLIVAVLEQPRNTIQIKLDELVYACISLHYPLSSYEILSKDSINSYTSTPALIGSLYSYDGNKIKYIRTGMKESVQIENKSSHPVVAGLAKHFTINSTEKPLSITTTSSILFNGKGTFPIINSYFLTAISNSEVGTVIPVEATSDLFAVPSSIAIQPLLLLNFSNAKLNQSVLYNNDNNKFILK